MASNNQKAKIDDVLTFLTIKRLVTPISKTNAFNMGLVDTLGKTIKVPETDEEKEALTLLDKFIFKVKRLLGGKLAHLNNFLFVQTLGNDFYNQLVVKSSIDQRAEIKRLRTDIQKLEEKYNLDDILPLLIHQLIRENTDENGRIK